MMKKNIFAVSDIHGHYDELRKALKKAGFRENNENDYLIVCGDLFDRGDQNLEVFNYIKQLNNCLLIRGNHEDILCDVLENRFADIVDLHNGIDKTLESFFGKNTISEGGELIIQSEKEALTSELLDFINSMKNYVETNEHIFCHGWLPFSFGDNGDYTVDGFRTADEISWCFARETSWCNAIQNPDLVPSGKKVVCGHRASEYGRQFDVNRKKGDYGIFENDSVIAIDGNVCISKRINVYKTVADIIF